MQELLVRLSQHFVEKSHVSQGRNFLILVIILVMLR